MQDQIDYLLKQLDEEREANRENRRLLAALVQRVPELEAARDAQNGPLTPSEGAGEGCPGSGEALLLVA